MPLYMPRGGPRILFAHVPKTAGSSVRTYLVKRFGRPSLSDNSILDPHHTYRQRGFVNRPAHFSAEDLLEFTPPDLDLTFAIVRDPLKRILSEYGFQQNQSLLSKQPFSTWLRTVLKAAEKDRRLFHNHIRPQTEMIPEGAEIFRLEDGLDQLEKRLDEVCGGGVDYGIEHINKSKAAKDKTVVRQQDVELVLRFFASDYDQFGYERPNPNDYPADPGTLGRNLFAGVAAPLLVAHQHRKWLR